MAVLTVLFLTGVVAAPEPRHPLSQIYPTDTDLNMSNYGINNVSEITLNNGIGSKGLVLDNFAITHEGDAQKFVLDYSNDEWDILNSNLNMNGNNITNIDALNFQDGFVLNGSVNTSGGDLNLDNGSINEVYSIDGGGDAVRMEDQLDMNGNAIIDSTGNLELQGEVYLPTGDLDMGGNNIVNPGTVNGIDLDNPGNGLGVTGSQLRIEQGGVGNTELNNSQNFTVDGLKTTSDINMSGNSIVNSNVLEFNSPGNIRTDGVNAISIDSSQNVEVVQGNLDVATGDLMVEDGASGDPSIGFNDDSDTGIYSPANGNIGFVLDGSEQLRIRSDNTIDFYGADLTQVGGTSAASSGAIRIANNENIVFRNNADSGDVEALSVDTGDNIELPGGNVEIPNGDLSVSNPSNTDNTADIGGSLGVEGALDMNANNISDVDSISGSSSQDLALSVSGTGGAELILANSGNVQVNNGELDLQGNSVVDSTSSNTVYVGDGADDAVVLDAPGNVEVQGGNLDLNSDSIVNYYGSSCPQGEVVVDVQDDGSFQCMEIAGEVSDEFVNRSGDTMTGDLNMLGNDIYNVSNVGIGTSSPQENLDVDGTAEIQSGGTTMKVDSTGDVVVTLGG